MSKKQIVFLAVACWLWCGLYGHALTQGFFFGRFKSQECRADQHAAIPKWISYTGVEVASAVAGPINLAATALFLGNDKRRWAYGTRWCYWDRLDECE